MSRQRLIVPTKPLYIVLNILTFLVFAGMFVYLVVRWDQIPSKIASHFNFAGEPDSWSGRGSVLILPLIGAGVCITIAVVERFPQIWNTGVRLTAQNAERVLVATKGLLTVMRTFISLSFAYITYCTITSNALGVWFLPVFLAALFLPMIYYFLRIYRSPR